MEVQPHSLIAIGSEGVEAVNSVGIPSTEVWTVEVSCAGNSSTIEDEMATCTHTVQRDNIMYNSDHDQERKAMSSRDRNCYRKP